MFTHLRVTPFLIEPRSRVRPASGRKGVRPHYDGLFPDAASPVDTAPTRPGTPTADHHSPHQGGNPAPLPDSQSSPPGNVGLSPSRHISSTSAPLLTLDTRSTRSGLCPQTVSPCLKKPSTRRQHLAPDLGLERFRRGEATQPLAARQAQRFRPFVDQENWGSE